LPDADYIALWATVKKVAQRLKLVTGRKRVGIHVIGIDVPHAHVHVFPFDNVAQYRGVANMTAEPDHTALSVMAKKLAFKTY